MSALYYKNHKVLVGMFKRAWHPKLIELLTWLTVRHSKITLTSASRDKPIHSNDSGIHMTDPLRAFDLRSRDFPDPKRIEADINANFVYDPQRPYLQVCVYHDTGFGHHFHCQVHNRTYYRKPK